MCHKRISVVFIVIISSSNLSPENEEGWCGSADNITCKGRKTTEIPDVKRRRNLCRNERHPTKQGLCPQLRDQTWVKKSATGTISLKPVMEAINIGTWTVQTLWTPNRRRNRQTTCWTGERKILAACTDWRRTEPSTASLWNMSGTPMGSKWVHEER